MIYIMELSYIQDQKITKYAIEAKLSAVTVQDKRIKNKIFMFGCMGTSYSTINE